VTGPEFYFFCILATAGLMVLVDWVAKRDAR
jgi:hypothetical protein